jgi:polar amino acid transport system substrate-binding protein
MKSWLFKLRKPRLKRRWTGILAVVAVTLALAGCGSGSTPPTTTPPFVAPLPDGVQDPAVLPTGTSQAPAPDCNPVASLRPSGSLPRPGAMPAGSTMAKIVARGRLIAGVSQNTYLFGFRDATTGEIKGFDVDIVKEVATAIFGDWQNHVQFVAVTSAQRIPYVNEGKVDIVAATMTMNCTRWQQVNFSSQYFDAQQMVLVPKASPVTGIKDLGGKKICAASGSTSIQNIAKADPKPIPVAVSDWTDCLVMLQQGQVDAISTDNTILAGLAAQDPTTHVVGAGFSQEPYGMAMSQQTPDLVRFVNGVLEQIRANGRWTALFHSNNLLGPDTPPAAVYKD